jgi:hypothetical protein
MDLTKFANATFTQREASIAVPELAEWFDKGEEPVWIVRGLTAAELGRASQAASTRAATLSALVNAMAGEGDKANEIRKAMGLSDEEVPEDVSRRIEMLVAGSVSPKLTQDQRDVVVKLAESFPTTFYALTNKITNLTGQGAELGKRKPSGKTPA